MTSQRPGTGERRIRVLWNPTSGRKGGVPTNRASREMLLELLPRHGLGDELVEPSSEHEAASAARDAVERGYDMVVAAGGDGTTGLVGRQLMGTYTALGILPLGSVMNIPRMLGLPRDVEEAARILAAGHVRSIDVGQAGDHTFFEAASVGMHAAATRELPKVDSGDYGAIIRSVVAMVRYQPSAVRIELDRDRDDRDEGAPRRGRQRSLHRPGAPRRTRGLARRRPVRRACIPSRDEGGAGPGPHARRLRSPPG